MLVKSAEKSQFRKKFDDAEMKTLKPPSDPIEKFDNALTRTPR